MDDDLNRVLARWTRETLRAFALITPAAWEQQEKIGPAFYEATDRLQREINDVLNEDQLPEEMAVEAEIRALAREMGADVLRAMAVVLEEVANEVWPEVSA